MSRKKIMGAGAIVKHFRRLGPHPWIWSKIAKLEMEKRFFDLIYNKAENGLADKIRQVSIRITDICNLRCHTCGQWGDSGFLHDTDLKSLKKDEVSADRYLSVFADLVRHKHHPLVYFWGGEPMLYDGILDLIDGAAAMGLPPSIATNGTNVARSAERLVKAPLFLLQISIDGHDAETHNASRPSAGGGNNFRDILNGLENIKKVRQEIGKGLPVIASLTTISRNNFRNLVDIYESFRDKVDQFIFYPAWWIDEKRAQDHEQDFSRRFGFPPVKHRGWIGDWLPDDYKAMDDQFQELMVRSRPLKNPPVTIVPPVMGVDNLETYYTKHQATFGFDQCLSIFQAVEINSNGDMSPCRDYHDYVVGNIKENTISQIWNNEKYVKFRKSLTTEGLMPVCSRCCGLMGY